MKLSKIRISQILAVDELEWQPGPFTRVTGGNEVGKTSVLEAIKAVCAGGHDATLLRRGAKKGEVVLAFEDGHTIAKTITANRSELKVTDREGEEVKRPAEFMRRLWDALAANPVDFVRGTDKERIDWLLECVDRDAAFDRIAEVTGMAIDRETCEPMPLLANARKSIYEERRDHNRDAKKAAEHAEALGKDLPGREEDLAGELAEAEAELERRRDMLEAARVIVQERAAADSRKAVADAQTTSAKIEGQIEALRRNFEGELSDLKRKIDGAWNEAHERERAIQDGLRESLDRTDSEARGDLDALKARVATLQERKATASAAEERRRLAAKAREEAREAERRAEECSQVLDQIDGLKRELLASLPIEGVDVDPETNGLTIKGTPFHRLNEATQWSIAILLARHRAGEIGIICADGLELLDDANFESFRAMAMESGLEFIVTDRGNGALAVTAEGRIST